MILLSAKVSANEISKLRRTRAIEPNTDVVCLAFCESSLPPEDKMSKKMLEEVHTYVELKHDKRASLPESFTICSTIMTTTCQTERWPMFFNILDDYNGQLMAPFLGHGFMESRLSIAFESQINWNNPSKKPVLFVWRGSWCSRKKVLFSSYVTPVVDYMYMYMNVFLKP